uniref:G protein-coupled receptor n=1 Tax=Parascaris univalens TaxID=6257 RepID=A0A915C916_PARUN
MKNASENDSQFIRCREVGERDENSSNIGAKSDRINVEIFDGKQENMWE